MLLLQSFQTTNTQHCGVNIPLPDSAFLIVRKLTQDDLADVGIKARALLLSWIQKAIRMFMTYKGE